MAWPFFLSPNQRCQGTEGNIQCCSQPVAYLVISSSTTVLLREGMLLTLCWLSGSCTKSSIWATRTEIINVYNSWIQYREFHTFVVILLTSSYFTTYFYGPISTVVSRYNSGSYCTPDNVNLRLSQTRLRTVMFTEPHRRELTYSQQ